MRRFDLRADDVVEAQALLIELRRNGLNIINIPGYRMEMLTEAIVELLH